MTHHTNPISVEIISTGDELNRGEVIDKNAAFLAAELTKLGFYVRFRQGINDRASDLKQAFRYAASRVDLVVVTGGLGPTEDDHTVDTLCELLQVTPVEENNHRERLLERLSFLQAKATTAHLRQIRIPKGATVLENQVGSAPGFHVMFQEKPFFFLPGVPKEMKSMFQDQMRPILLSLFPNRSIHQIRTYRIFGLGESGIRHQIEDILQTLPSFITVHYCAAFPEVLLTFSAQKEIVQEAEEALNRLSILLYQRIGKFIYAEGNKGLPEIVGEALKNRGETVSTAESCTGGMLGQLMTSISGSSCYYLGGIISYDNQVKKDLLGVHEKTLQRDGAVSEKCVQEMAEGVRTQIRTNYGISISGVAGPLGGSEDKPVGTVCIGLSTDSHFIQKVQSKTFLFSGDREQIRIRACYEALYWLYQILVPSRNSIE